MIKFLKDSMKSNKCFHAAFTLIELLVVISVLGLLVLVIILNVRGIREKSDVAGGMQFYSTIKKSLSNEAVGFWSFDNNDVKDDSGNNFNGIINGATATDGILRRAFSFNGSSNYIRFTFPSAYTFRDFTYSAWIKPSDTSSWREIVDVDDDKQLLAVFDGKLAIYGRCGTNYFSQINTGSWYYVVWTVSGSNYEVYLNSKKVGSGGGCGASVSGSDLMVGAGCCANEYFAGIIDDVGVYNRKLSSYEIQNLYFAGLIKHNNLARK